MARPRSFRPSIMTGMPKALAPRVAYLEGHLLPGWPVGGRSRSRITPRYEYGIGLEMDAELQSPCINDGSVRRDETNSRTGLGRRRNHKPKHRSHGEQLRYEVPCLHFCSMLLPSVVSTSPLETQ